MLNSVMISNERYCENELQYYSINLVHQSSEALIRGRDFKGVAEIFTEFQFDS